MKARVFKLGGFAAASVTKLAHPRKPKLWVADTPLGFRYFYTWEEAMGHALWVAGRKS